MNLSRQLLPIVFVKLDSNQFSCIMTWLGSLAEQPSVNLFIEKDSAGNTSIGSTCISNNDKTNIVNYVYASKLNTDELEIAWNDMFSGPQRLCIDFTSMRNNYRDVLSENSKKGQGQFVIYQVDPDMANVRGLDVPGFRYTLGIEMTDMNSNHKTSVDGFSRSWIQSPGVKAETTMIRLTNVKMTELLVRSSKKARDLKMTIWQDPESPDLRGFVFTNTTSATTNNTRISTYNVDTDHMEHLFSFSVPMDRISSMRSFLSVFKPGTVRISYTDTDITFANRFCSSGEQSMTFALQ